MGVFSRSSISRKSKDGMKIIATAFFGINFGFLIGLSFPSLSITKINIPTKFLLSNDLSYIEEKGSRIATPESHKSWSSSKNNDGSSSGSIDKSKIWVPSNPRGAEMLPPGMVAAESDFYLRRLWGLPQEDLTSEPKYLATFTVGINQKANIDACVKKDMSQ